MQNQFLIFGGDGNTFLHVVRDCGDVFSHVGYSGPTTYADFSDEDYEKRFPRSVQKFHKTLVSFDGVGSIECYLHETEYKYYLEQYLKNEIKENNIRNQKELTDWVNGHVLKYFPN